ncbi:hypothetical protein GOP47_0016963 [Adiantum capillus-veneris]|uniref:Cilia- and flagella-associated protein 53 n=1 Tax=Adiantum capillus-veneris TaxID=13818 RepID=A0A9D4ZAT7_ADICA|nr:hypothetical protein GOP47_0016963 [Adiantum capillus-veneris]
MYFHPKRLPVNEDRIIKHRHYEDDLRDRLISVHNYEGLMRRAEFENSNEPKICYRSLSERLEAIRAQRDRVIFDRQNRVKQMLDDESATLEEEMKTGNMNLSERRTWLETEARRMRTERLERMLKYAQTQLERAFQDSSDDVRIHNSKLAVKRAEEERKRQRRQNIEKRAQAKEDELALHKCMELEWQRQDELHQEELELKQARKQEAIDILREQLGMVQRLHEEERAAVEEDMINMNKRWLEEEEELKRKQYEQRQVDSQKAKQMLLYNEHNRAKKLTEAQEEKKYDAHMIAMVAEREAEEERQEKELREAQRREARAYAAQLKAAIDRQKVEDDELEAVIRAELAEDWRKRDEQTQRQEDARKQLYDEVYEGRHSQIQFKESIKREQEEEKLAQLEKYRADAEKFRLEDQKRAEDIHLTKQEVKGYLEDQMRHRRAEELVTQQLQRADFEDTKAAEKKYEGRVKQALSGLPYPEPYYGRKAVKWYE